MAKHTYIIHRPDGPKHTTTGNLIPKSATRTTARGADAAARQMLYAVNGFRPVGHGNIIKWFAPDAGIASDGGVDVYVTRK